MDIGREEGGKEEGVRGREGGRGREEGGRGREGEGYSRFTRHWLQLKYAVLRTRWC